MKQIDRIRNMKKAELVELALKQPICGNCLADKFCDECDDNMRCADIWKAWLESEVAE